MTIDEVVVWAKEEVARAEENARNCYSIGDISVEALQRAADKVNQCRTVRDMILKLYAIEKIVYEKDFYTDEDAKDHFERIKKIIDSAEVQSE